jgi:hypothetical protein
LCTYGKSQTNQQISKGQLKQQKIVAAGGRIEEKRIEEKNSQVQLLRRPQNKV